MQADGIIDPAEGAIAGLKSIGVIPEEKIRYGINTYLFNSLFSTNGFVIMTAADDIDLIYYNAVNPVSDPNAAMPALLTVYYQSIISKQPPINCTDGVLASKEQKIDYLQTKNVLTCIQCRPGTFFHRQHKDCFPFPIIHAYLNLFDVIV